MLHFIKDKGMEVTHEESNHAFPLYPRTEVPKLPEKMPAFGEAIRSEFMLDFDNMVFANFPSWGACPRRIYDYRYKL